MNFLLHRHLSHRDLESSLAGVGAMLPDLWRLADRRVRPAPRKLAWETLGEASEEARDVMRGIDHHLDADHWFHDDADVFTTGERATIEALRAARTSAKKLTLFAHPLWEMCLDGALVRRLGAAAVRSSVAEGFRAAGAAMRAAALAHSFAHVEDGAARADDFDARMRGVADELSKGPWIEAYSRPQGLARALAGIRKRFGLPPFEGAEREAIELAIGSLDARADAALDRILSRRA